MLSGFIGSIASGLLKRLAFPAEGDELGGKALGIRFAVFARVFGDPDGIGEIRGVDSEPGSLGDEFSMTLASGGHLLIVMPANDGADGEDQQGNGDGDFHEVAGKLFKAFQDLSAEFLVGNLFGKDAGLLLVVVVHRPALQEGT